MASEPVLLRIDQAIAQLRLNRPEVHNVVNEELLTCWEGCLSQIEADSSIRAVILTASGDQTFCAGGDLRWFSRLDQAHEVRSMSERMQNLLNRLYEGHRPVIAAINGSAYGGGCEVLTACHFRIAVTGSTFQFRQSAMGVVTGWGGGLRLIRQLGRGRALELLLGGASIDSEKALHMGLVDRVVSLNQLEAEALSFAELIALRSPASIEAFLELARLSEQGSTAEIRERETQLFLDCWQGPWFRAAVDKFLEKRGSK